MLVISALALYDKGTHILCSRIFTAASYVALTNELYVRIKKECYIAKKLFFHVFIQEMSNIMCDGIKVYLRPLFLPLCLLIYV